MLSTNDAKTVALIVMQMNGTAVPSLVQDLLNTEVASPEHEFRVMWTTGAMYTGENRMSPFWTAAHDQLDSW